MSEAARAKRFTNFTCEKRPATGSRAMVVTNHPLASAAGAEMLLAGGNAVDGAVAGLFALTVVEPMMVGILGGGIAHIRLADGRHVVLDALGTAPGNAHGAMYETVSDELPDYRKTVGRANEVGPLAVAVPGALAGWCRALGDFGTMSLEDVTAPAGRLAERGFTATPYLADCVADLAPDLGRDPGLAALFLPGGSALRAGRRVVQPEYAQTLRTIARHGADALHGGELGAALAATMSRTGGLVSLEDLAPTRSSNASRSAAATADTRSSAPAAGVVRGARGADAQRPRRLRPGRDGIRLPGYGTPARRGDEDRVRGPAVATADPAFVDVPSSG